MKLKEKLIKNKNFRKFLFVSFIFILLGSCIFLINERKSQEQDFIETSEEPIIITEDYIYLPDLGVGYNLSGGNNG